MEPLFSPEDEKSLLPRELHTKYQAYHRPYGRHSVHMITQYYVPEDPHRAREVSLSDAMFRGACCRSIHPHQGLELFAVTLWFAPIVLYFP